MPTYVSNEMQPAFDPVPNMSGNPALGGRMRVYRATIKLNDLRLSTTSGTPTAGLIINDAVLACDLPAGVRVVGHEIISSVGLGTTTINVGVSSTHENNTKYGSGITVGTANTVVRTVTAAMRGAAALPAPERVFVSFGTAAIAASNNHIVIDFMTVAA